MSVDKRWIKRKDAPVTINRYSALSMGQSKIITFIQSRGINYADYESRLHSYDVHKDEWDEMIAPDQFSESIDGTRAVLDAKRNKLYLKVEGKMNLIEINVNTKKMAVLSSSEKKDVGSYFGFVIVDDTIHIIGGNKTTKHLSFNLNEQKCREIHDFQHDVKSDNLFGSKVVHVRSKSVLLLIGGASGKLGVWRFCLKSAIWTKLDDISSKFDYYNVAATLTSNEQYVIIGGGYNSGIENSSEIFVLDIRDDDKYELFVCDLRLPHSGYCHLVAIDDIHRDRCLVNGFVKMCALTVPQEIIDMIFHWYSEEMIHCLNVGYTRDTHAHFCVSLNVILSTLTMF